jgi:hypothetical protein
MIDAKQDLHRVRCDTGESGGRVGGERRELIHGKLSRESAPEKNFR